MGSIKIITNEQKFLLFSMIVAGILIAFSIKPGHNWGGDFSLYINQTKYLLASSLNELYEANKLSMQASLTEIGPYLYPNGFPVLLSPIYYLFGMDFMALKIYCSTFFIFSIPLIYFLIQHHFSERIFPAIIIFSIAINNSFISFTDNILSDLPFFFFCYAALNLFDRDNNFKNQILKGVFLFIPYFIRHVGVCLIPVLFAYQLIQSKKNTEQPQKWFFLILPYLIFFGLFLLTKKIFPNGGENHVEMLISNFSLSLIFQNVLYYLKLMSSYFFYQHSIILGLVILLVAILGMWRTWRQSLPFIVFIWTYLSIMIIWPFHQGLRFIFPLIPLILFFIFHGVFDVFEKLKQSADYLPALFLTYLIGYSFITFFIIRPDYFSAKKTNEAYTDEMQTIYKYISEFVSDDEIIGFEKPRVLFLFTNKKSIYTKMEHFEKSKADFFLFQKEKNTPTFNKNFNIQQEFLDYVILEKRIE